MNWLRGGVVAVGVLLVAGCEEKPTAAPPPPLVQVMTVATEDLPVTNTWVGTLAGDVNADIRAQVSGYLLTQNYANGTPVKKGDLLFQIDPRPFQASLDQAKGNLAQADAQLTKDKLNADRATELYKKQVISREQYDDTLQQYQASKAASDASRAAVETAQLNLDFTSITSPIDGVSSIATAQVGDLVGPSTGTLATVSTVDPIKVNFSVAEQEYINYVQQFFADPTKSPIATDGQRAITTLELTLANGTVFPHPGKLTAVNNIVGSGTGSLSLQGLFPNPGGLLRPGQFGLVSAVTRMVPNGIAVPQRAIGELQGQAQVAVVGPGDKVTMRMVKTGPRIGSLIVVDEGLAAGDVIVVEGLQKVKDGAVVRTQPYEMDTAEKDSVADAMPPEAAPGPEITPTPTATPEPAN